MREPLFFTKEMEWEILEQWEVDVNKAIIKIRKEFRERDLKEMEKKGCNYLLVSSTGFIKAGFKREIGNAHGLKEEDDSVMEVELYRTLYL